MVKRIGTQQRKTRYKFKRHLRERGKISVSKYLQKFAVGDLVNLKINSAVQHGRFFPRFYGLSGKITGKRGACYEVSFKDRSKEKVAYVHPIHLERQR